MNFVLYICSIFLLSIFISIVIIYKNNPYIGSKFYLNKDKGDKSPLYISMVSVVDGNGKPIPKFKRVSCVPFEKYTKSISDWFYNTDQLIDFISITEEEATEIYKKHKKYTNEIKSTYG